MTEAEFINSIDCCFPYKNAEKAFKIIEFGSSISPNASFAVLHELARAPTSQTISEAQLLKLLGHWKLKTKHPLKTYLLPIVEQLIEGKTVSKNKAANAIKEIAKYPHQLSALAIAYFSCDDENGEISKLYNHVIQLWEKVS